MGAATPPFHAYLCEHLSPLSRAPCKSSSSLSLIAFTLGYLEEALPALSPPSAVSQ